MLGEDEHLVQFRTAIQASARNVNMLRNDLESATLRVLAQLGNLHSNVLLDGAASRVDGTAIILRHGFSLGLTSPRLSDKQRPTGNQDNREHGGRGKQCRILHASQ